MTQRTFLQRFLFYLILAGLCFIVPIITTTALILFTGNRELGMSIAIIPTVLIVHFIFSTVFLKTNRFIKFTIPILTASIAILGLKYILPLKIFDNLFEMVWFWDVVIFHLLITIIIWELTYQLLIKLIRQKT